MSKPVVCAKGGHEIPDKDVTERGYHQIGRPKFTRIFYKCSQCENRGLTLVKVNT